MTIGKHECQLARGTDLHAAIRIGLDEATTALEESIYDLTDEQVMAFPVAGRNNIAWIVMHCLQNLDHYANTAATDDRDMPARVLQHDDRYDLSQAPAEKRPKQGDVFPTVQQMLNMLNRVRDSAMSIVEDRGPANVSRASHWSEHEPGVVADAYMRTIMHTMSHTRQIWALRGVMGLVDADRQWPRQHWA